MTLILKRDLVMHHQTKTEDSTSTTSKVIARTDAQTDRQTQTQTLQKHITGQTDTYAGDNNPYS